MLTRMAYGVRSLHMRGYSISSMHLHHTPTRTLYPITHQSNTPPHISTRAGMRKLPTGAEQCSAAGNMASNKRCRLYWILHLSHQHLPQKSPCGVIGCTLWPLRACERRWKSGLPRRHSEPAEIRGLCALLGAGRSRRVNLTWAAAAE